jgi:hypothetical protein
MVYWHFLLLPVLINSCVKDKVCDNCDPEPPIENAQYQLILRFNHTNIDTLYSRFELNGRAAKASNIIRAIIDVYPNDNAPQTRSNRIIRIVHDINQFLHGTNEVHILTELPSRQCKLVAWVSGEGDYYLTDDLASITIKQSDTPVEYEKYAYTGVVDVDVRQAIPNEVNFIIMNLETPMANFIMVASDVRKFIQQGRNIDISNLRTQIKYNLWLPYGYNAIEQRVNYFQENATTYSDIIQISADSAIIAHDYIFIDRRKSDPLEPVPDLTVNLNFLIYEKTNNSNIVSGLNAIDLPLKMGWLTIASGDFLTASHAQGGIGIDDNFDGEIVIVWPD